MKNLHIKISLLCYMVCLTLPGYYVGEQYEPQIGYQILSIGWLGPVSGHFSWYANPLFLISLILSGHPKRSSIFCFISLVLAISFIFYSDIMASKASSKFQIKAYGLGYWLWVTSFTIFFLGQWFRTLNIRNERINYVSIFSITTLIFGYSAYYFFGTDSLYTIQREREQEFEKRCTTAGEQIYKTTNGVRGVFFDPYWKRIRLGSAGPTFIHIDEADITGVELVNSEHLQFYETRDKSMPNKYIRYSSPDFIGKPVDRLESEYAVITEFYKIPKRLNIYGATIIIKNLHNNSVLATSSYVADKNSGRYCGSQKLFTSTNSFVTKVLNLS